jgi:hypothetical protein
MGRRGEAGDPGGAGERRVRGKRVVFTDHAARRLAQRGTTQETVVEAIRTGEPEAAQRGLTFYRLNLEFNRDWHGRRYRMQQVAPVVAEEEDRLVVVTVYTFYFQEEARQ